MQAGRPRLAMGTTRRGARWILGSSRSEDANRIHGLGKTHTPQGVKFERGEMMKDSNYGECEYCRKRKRCYRAERVNGCELFSVDSRIDPWSYRKCRICGRLDGIHEHHIFGGANRNHSDAEGLTVDLCVAHHLGDFSPHMHAGLAQEFHELGQRVYEECYGEGTFIKSFGRNYL